MKCSQCGFTDSAVIDSRESDDATSVRRRRECPTCKYRFTTYERLEQPRLMVVKKDSTRELYDRDKIAAGVYKAFHKRPLSVAGIEGVIDEIERDVFELNLDEVGSRQVGELVMRRIEMADPVAYIRFAAVYQEFQDLVTFDREIKKLIEKKTKVK